MSEYWHENTIKKGKVPETGERKSFIGTYCRSLEFSPSKINKLQIFLRVLPQKEKTLRQTRNLPSLTNLELQIQRGKDLFV